jgi:hypothetical protein
MRTKVAALEGLKIMNDPKRCSRRAGCSATSGEHAEGMKFPRARSTRATVADARGRPGLRRLRGDAAFQQLLADAEAGHQQALADFRESGGERLLGR